MILPEHPAIEVFEESALAQSIAAVQHLPARDDIRRILIIKWGGMGDAVMSSAIMEDIFRAFPGRDIHLNAMPPWETLFAHDPRFSRVWSVDLREKERGLKGTWRWLRTARAGHYDLIVDLQSNDRSRLLLTALLMSGTTVPWRIGNMPVFPYNVRQPRLPRTLHIFQRMRAALLAAGIPALTARPVLHPSPAQRQRAQEVLQQHGLLDQKFAVFLPGSHAVGLTKRWGVQNYSRLAQLLQERGLPRIVLIGGPDEVEECAAIARTCGDLVVNLCGSLHLLELPPLYARAAFIVANDTGTAHLAAASDVPMLVLCGPTDPRRIKPVGRQVIALQPDLPCKNCYRKTCDHHTCMQQALTPDIVLAHLGRLTDRG